VAETVSESDVVKWEEQQCPIVTSDALLYGACHHIEHIVAMISQCPLRAAGGARGQKDADYVVISDKNVRLCFVSPGYQLIVLSVVGLFAMEYDRELDAFHTPASSLDDIGKIRIKKNKARLDVFQNLSKLPLPQNIVDGYEYRTRSGTCEIDLKKFGTVVKEHRNTICLLKPYFHQAIGERIDTAIQSVIANPPLPIYQCVLCREVGCASSKDISNPHCHRLRLISIISSSYAEI
jgi:hypothetical protein